MVPVTTLVAGHGSVAQLVRLWLVTLAANLAGGLAMAAIVIGSHPGLGPTAARIGRHYATLGTNWHSLALAVLVGARLFHSVLDSIFMFAGLVSGHAAYTWADWAGDVA